MAMLTDRSSSPSVSAQVDRLGPALALLTAVLVVVAALAGLFVASSDSPVTVATVHGEVVDLYGEGLYKLDTVFRGAGNRGTDTVLLGGAVPLLLASLVAHRRARLGGTLLLVGVLGWVAYVYATMALATAYNPLFLVYVASFACALWAAVALIRRIDMAELNRRVGQGRQRALAYFLAFAGVFTAAMWMQPIIAGLGAGTVPPLLGHSTTLVTEALDLALVVPGTFAAAYLLLKGDATGGSLVAVPLLTLLTALAPTIVAQTVFQVQAGVEYTTAEIAGPIAGFLLLGSLSAWFLLRLIRRP